MRQTHENKDLPEGLIVILLIRHGEADHHVQSLTGGWTDSALTEKGRNQFRKLADVLAREFAGHKAPVIYTSDLLRCRSGAEILAAALGVKTIKPCSFLREKNNGRAAGLSNQEARKFYHAPVTGRELDHVNYDGGETRRQFYERTVAGLGPLLREEDPVLVVAHKGTIQNILFYWLGLDIEEVARKQISFDIRPGSLTMIGVNKWEERTIFLLNDLSCQQGCSKIGIFDLPFIK
jgi:probable phosphoglycerate mutase